MITYLIDEIYEKGLALVVKRRTNTAKEWL